MSSEEFDRVKNVITEHVQQTYRKKVFVEAWQNLPEIPSRKEIMPLDDDTQVKSDKVVWNDYQKDLVHDKHLPTTTIDGPWPSKEKYLGAYYQILREDAIAGLRKSVAQVRERPSMADNNDTCIYTNVTIRGLLLSRMGVAFQIEFSCERAGKQICWEQSKRLIAGTIVAITPMHDCFRSICKVAVVAARPLQGGLDQDPPSIDIFWAEPNDAAIDPVEEYMMVESRCGYFEASRHVLIAIQKLMTEKFHLANHLVSLDQTIRAPTFLQDRPMLNLRSLVREDIEARHPRPGEQRSHAHLENVSILEGFPDVPHTGMDASQFRACKEMLTKRLSIVIGPPGTGKTFVSVAALKVMIQSLSANDPPIIIAAQTNHAIDQLLTAIMESEPNILRLGGRSDKNNLEILKRTLHELRGGSSSALNHGKQLKASKRDFAKRSQEIKDTMCSLINGEVLTAALLLEQGIITMQQLESLNDDQWREEDQVVDIIDWMKKEQLITIPRTPSVNLGLPLEEVDIEYEQIRHLGEDLPCDEHEYQAKGDLSGERIHFKRQLTGKHSGSINDKRIRKMLIAKPDLFDIPEGCRGEVYRYWEKQSNAKMLQELQILLGKYESTVQAAKIAQWQLDVRLIQNLGIRIIGCTTTGLSKYRGLLAALRPRTLLIEEAAETLEPTITAGMFDSLEQLILVGDHKQLQAHCNIRELEGAPYHLNVSMFERLVGNSIGHVMLNQQRRMISNIRELLCIEPAPFYDDLHDHPSVLDRIQNRPPVPGMGGRDTYFFSHNWPEAVNSDLSRYNKDEADMIVGFFRHLILNGVQASNITILTFYNSQRKVILQALKSQPSLSECGYFHVHTVDSYQGEENDIILLSLVRSNSGLGIGFLNNKNRLVVALSRARRGLYIFGNSVTLAGAETVGEQLGRDPLWLPLIKHMKNMMRYDLDKGFIITCSRHVRPHEVKEPDHWLDLAGGCNESCKGVLECGHSCPHKCHPFEHDAIVCSIPCARYIEDCGHTCSGSCGEPCYCLVCVPARQAINLTDQDKIETSKRLARRGVLQSPLKSRQWFAEAPESGIFHALEEGSKQSSHFEWKFSEVDALQRRPLLPETEFPMAGCWNSESNDAQSVSSPLDWQNFNAREHDLETLEQYRTKQPDKLRIHEFQSILKEKFLQTEVINGQRQRCRPSLDGQAFSLSSANDILTTLTELGINNSDLAHDSSGKLASDDLNPNSEF